MVIYLLIICSNGIPADIVILLALESPLEKTTALILETRLNANASLTYREFWAELRARFARDMLLIHRQAWRQVKLETASEIPTLQEWNEYEVQYLHKRSFVDDWDEKEDRESVFRQVPREFRKELIEETFRKRDEQHLVLVAVSYGLSCQQVLEALEGSFGKGILRCAMH